MSDKLRFRDGRVAIGFPIEIGAMAEIRRRIPGQSRAFDPQNRELLISEDWGLTAVDILEGFDGGAIGGAA